MWLWSISRSFKDDSDLTDRSGYDLNRPKCLFYRWSSSVLQWTWSTCKSLSGWHQGHIKDYLWLERHWSINGKTKESHATTRDIFGDYIHKYYYNQSIIDGFTLRLMRKISRRLIRIISDLLTRDPTATCRKISLYLTMWSLILRLYHKDFNRARDFGLWWPDYRWHDCLWFIQTGAWSEKAVERRQAGSAKLDCFSSFMMRSKEGQVDAYKEGKVIIVYSMLLTGLMHLVSSAST